jgi:hypothetical protein
MKRRGLAYLGLAKPYRFQRTLAGLTALLLGGIAAAACLSLYLADQLAADSPRAFYFLYLAALIALALLLVPLTRLAAVPLTVAALEIGLGIGSLALQRLGVSQATLLPANQFTHYRSFTWHPLLQGVPIPSRAGDWGRTEAYHNAQRLRGRERTVESVRQRIAIELFGGSTTYDVAAENGRTWGDILESLLGADRFAVLNHGMPAYSSAMHVVQTAFYQQPYGEQPACAIYYMGWNELPNTHVRGLDPGYADHQVRSLTETLFARRTDGLPRLISPTLTLATRLLVYAADTLRPVPRPAGEASGAPDPALEAIYVRNIRTISAINRQRAIRTLWVGQVMSREHMTRGREGGWVLFVSERDMGPLIDWLNGILRREAEQLGDVYVDVPAGRFGPQDFFDIGHFVASGSAKFAEALLPSVAKACGGAEPGGS